ncbi:MAG TPA: GGDEF domain-containing protein [Anaerolineales bacterium]|nr:GGDEF domain-containing protein [Anaerolineales bacterium]
MTQFLPKRVFEKFQAVYENVPESLKPPKESSPFALSLEEFLEISGSQRDLGMGEILFQQDDAADCLYWIESGVLGILQGDLDTPRLLGFRYPGQVVGEIALLEDIPRTATVAAILPARLKYLSKEKFQAFLQLIPGVGIEIMRLLSARLREIQPAEYGNGLYDPLTGALSRQVFDSRLQEEIKRAQLYRYSFLLAFLDLDNFKQINDTHGHARGDDVLVTFTQRIQSELRTTDLFFRYGGDEFILILPGMDHRRGQALIEHLLNESRSVPISGDPPIHVSFSAGIACYPEDGDTSRNLLKVADDRLYQAKRGGRGTFSQG